MQNEESISATDPAAQATQAINEEFTLGQVLTIVANGVYHSACFKGAEAKGAREYEIVLEASKATIIDGPVMVGSATGRHRKGKAETEAHAMTANVVRIRCVAD